MNRITQSIFGTRLWIARHKGITAVFLAVIMGAGAIGGVVYFETGHGTIQVKTGSESFMQTVYFNTTNANQSVEPLQVMNQNGTITNVTSTTALFQVAQDTSGSNGAAFSLNVANLTQGEYIIFTVGIKNTGAGNLPFAGYSVLNETENSPTGSPFYAWKENGTNIMQWNNGQNIGAVEGNYYPTYSLSSVLNTNQTSSFVSSGMNSTVSTNQTLDIITSGPQTGNGSSNANPYPAYIAPGQTVYYDVILGLGTYAPASYLNSTYSFSFSIGPS